MGRLIGCICDFIGGLWVLVSLAWISRFRFSSSYWTWRKQTAFPTNDPQRGRFPVIRLTLDYAQWAWRLRRLR